MYTNTRLWFKTTVDSDILFLDETNKKIPDFFVFVRGQLSNGDFLQKVLTILIMELVLVHI